jgi:hypothetical protein
MLHAFRTGLALLLFAAPVAAAEKHMVERADKNAGSDIVVTSPLQMPKNPDTVVASPPANIRPSPANMANYVDASRRAAACATRGQIVKLSLLRKVVDGTVSTPTQERAQDWLVRQTAACGEGAAIALGGWQIGAGGRASSNDNLGILYRGAFITETIKAFAPDITLTREQLADPIVQQRFIARESLRASKRLPFDIKYFRVAICMVREQPELATQLVRTDPIARSTVAIQAHLVNRARGCAGNPKRLVIDQYEFRNYVADALYRWILAVRDVDTLIPMTILADNAMRSPTTPGVEQVVSN